MGHENLTLVGLELLSKKWDHFELVHDKALNVWIARNHDKDQSQVPDEYYFVSFEGATLFEAINNALDDLSSKGY